MQRQFQKQVKLLSSPTPPHVVRHKYKSLTEVTCSELSCQEIDKCVQVAEDPDLVIDMQHLNKDRPRDTINAFFKELEAIVEDLTATDERRHGLAHMSQFLSISDLIKQVKARVPEGTNIPLESTVIHAFAPSNMYKKRSQYYTGHVHLKHAIQKGSYELFTLMHTVVLHYTSILESLHTKLQEMCLHLMQR